MLVVTNSVLPGAPGEIPPPWAPKANIGNTEELAWLSPQHARRWGVSADQCKVLGSADRLWGAQKVPTVRKELLRQLQRHKYRKERGDHLTLTMPGVCKAGRNHKAQWAAGPARALSKPHALCQKGLLFSFSSLESHLSLSHHLS